MTTAVTVVAVWFMANFLALTYLLARYEREQRGRKATARRINAPIGRVIRTREDAHGIEMDWLIYGDVFIDPPT